MGPVKQEIMDLGTFMVDVDDPQFKIKLKKLIDAIQNDDLTYNPFRKKL